MSTTISVSTPRLGADAGAPAGLRLKAASWFQRARSGASWLRETLGLPWMSSPSKVEREAVSVRALADSYLQSDPSFARDLHAAVDRYEAQVDAGLSVNAH